MGDRYLILGGSGFIGRHLVKYLYEKKLASKVCVADKVLYQIAGLSKAELAIYENKDFLTFKQADLANPESASKLYEYEGGDWKYVINLAASTKYSQGKEVPHFIPCVVSWKVYDANIVASAKNSAAAAAAHKVAKFIHVSTGQVYASGKKASTEADPVKPWTDIARAHHEAEEVVAGTAGLNYVIVRPSTVYGTGDINGITPRLIIGSIYKETGKKQQTLYTSGLRVSTVHVDDVAKALVHLTTKGENGKVYNLSDPNDTDQGKINKLLEGLFGIKTEFVNSIKMAAAKQMGTKFLVGFANDSHLKPFSDACKNPNALAVDGSAVTKTGFTYDHPAPTVENLKVVLQDYIEKGYFPKEMLA